MLKLKTIIWFLFDEFFYLNDNLFKGKLKFEDSFIKSFFSYFKA